MRNPIGSVVPAAKGLATQSFAAMQELGGATLQVFVGNPRGWRQSAGNPAQDALFRELCAEHATRVKRRAPVLAGHRRVARVSVTPSMFARTSAFAFTCACCCRICFDNPGIVCADEAGMR